VVQDFALPKCDLVHSIVTQCREMNPDSRPDLDFVIEQLLALKHRV
jgi:hypothetical protein